ncbi:hypothetical protein DFH09DRAFT_1342719 [Mycena vulgaris]|nr:hypothetical protein DFH09DRAFT_1342719 [Mycena vulgaris]
MVPLLENFFPELPSLQEPSITSSTTSPRTSDGATCRRADVIISDDPQHWGPPASRDDLERSVQSLRAHRPGSLLPKDSINVWVCSVGARGYSMGSRGRECLVPLANVIEGERRWNLDSRPQLYSTARPGTTARAVPTWQTAYKQGWHVQTYYPGRIRCFSEPMNLSIAAHHCPQCQAIAYRFSSPLTLGRETSPHTLPWLVSALDVFPLATYKTSGDDARCWVALGGYGGPSVR